MSLGSPTTLFNVACLHVFVVWSLVGFTALCDFIL